MKKKIILGVTVCLFAVTTMFNIGLFRQGNISDISLKNMQVMTQANAEVNPVEACQQLCWRADSYICYLWVTGTNIYIECWDRYPW